MRKKITRLIVLAVDWDGTLFDSLFFYYEVLINVYEHFGKKPPSLRKYKNGVGGGVLNFYKKNGLKKIPEKELKTIGNSLEKKLWKKAKPFYNSKVFLSICHNLGIKIMIVSNNEKRVIKKRVKELGWNRFIADVIGTPDKEKSLRDIRKELTPEKLFFIDDALHGIRAGKNAGFTTIGIATGWTSKKILEGAAPDFLAGSLQDALFYILKNRVN